MMTAALYGRLGADPRAINTDTGKAMTVVQMAVNIASRKDNEPDTAPLWIGLVAFRYRAEELLRFKKGDLISVMGSIQRNSWVDARTNEPREQLQLIVDAIVSARSTRPRGGKKAPVPATTELNDPLPGL